MRPARVFSVDLSHGGAPGHPESAFDSFCCLLSLGVDAEQLCGRSDLEAAGTIEVPGSKEDRTLDIRLALVPVKFQDYFVNNPAGYGR